MAAASLTRTIEGSINANAETLDHLSDTLQQWVRELVKAQDPIAGQVKDFLHGTWLGHPLHPVLTDVPIGAWASTAVLDMVGQENAADATLAIGLLAALPTALSGAADWSETGSQQRRTGLVHGLLNVVAVSCFSGSLVARRGDRRGLGLLLSAAGLAIASVSAWLGGDLVYRLGTAVSRDAWLPAVTDFHPLMPLDQLPEGKLTGAEVQVEGESQRVVLLRRGGDVLAVSATCTHEGGPLDEGELTGEDCVVCPWHGSQFDLRSGGVRHGPASAPVPAFDVRIQAGTIEVRTRS
jgi:nitrite reductase/ring-hydroxylating ferredoxin subunit/uncharacterized membrane protein